MKTTLFTLFLFATLVSFAQDNNTATQTSSVIVHKDPRVDLLVKKQASINTVTKKANQRSMRGYRLLIVNTHKREEAIDAKTKVYTYFPELKSYLAYQTPYFKLKAGNFKTRDEAEKYRKMMSTLFPKGVFIINDIIEIKYDKEELEELE
ncbi:MAG TPA: SPOR domain-containing protein [Chitinophagaceae bacterium]